MDKKLEKRKLEKQTIPLANQELWKKLDQQNNLRKVQWV